jgi:prevent-host-death family protein
MDMDERKPSVSAIKATQARIHFGEVLKRTYIGGERLVVGKNGIPLPIIISQADYDIFRRLFPEEHLEKRSQAILRGP